MQEGEQNQHVCVLQVKAYGREMLQKPQVAAHSVAQLQYLSADHLPCPRMNRSIPCFHLLFKCKLLQARRCRFSASIANDILRTTFMHGG